MIIEKVRKAALKVFSSEDTDLNLMILDDISSEEEATDLMAFLEKYISKYKPNNFKINYEISYIEKSINYNYYFNYLKNLNAVDFEKFCALLTKVFSYEEAFATKTSHDQGIDFIASKKWEHFDFKRVELLVGQSKNYSEKLVDVKDVRELAGAILLLRHREFSTLQQPYRRFNIKSFSSITSIFMSSYYFSPPAESLCEKSDIIPLNIIDLIFLLNKGVENNVFNIKLQNGMIDFSKLKKWFFDKSRGLRRCQ